MQTTRRQMTRRSNIRRMAMLTTVLASVLTLTTTALAQEWVGRARVAGRITDAETGQPLEGVTVTFAYQGAEGQGPDDILTDKKGRWSYLGLARGSWTITWKLDGYIERGGPVQISDAPGVRNHFDIQLRPDLEQRAQEAADKRLSTIEKGNLLLQQGDYAGAREAYETVMVDIRKDQHPILLREIARSYQMEGNSEQAIATLEKSLEIIPGDPDTLREMARIHYDQGDIDQAIATLDRLLEADPDDATTLQLVINLLVASDRETEAKPYMDRLPEGAKVDANTVLNMGIKLYNENDPEGALEYFNRAVEENAELADAYYYRGLTYLSSEKKAEAIADFKKFLELAPDHPSAGEAKSFLEYLEGE